MNAIFVRWLLLVLVAFDLASSPFHAHLHDADAPGAAVHAVAQAHAAGADEGLPEHDEPAFGHSLSALRSAHRDVAAPAADAVALASPATAELAPVVTKVLLRDAAPDGVAIPRSPHTRPEGRAPPGLHA